ncbi:hypothetical protein SynROS8604_01196 [Synechococcus sp. ROS8604]|nr:hypothetical protein SynROS8604_01196 [Synechococcus sp. ROS8604]
MLPVVRQTQRFRRDKNNEINQGRKGTVSSNPPLSADG